ncbi:MAG: response regulator [Candidatus Eisenbacteria bacterium]|nr:response regulator [Candidatus Eisenbacteria bacterium]
MAEWSFQRKLLTGVIVLCALAVAVGVTSMNASKGMAARLGRELDAVNANVTDARQLQLAGLGAILVAQAALLGEASTNESVEQAGSQRVRKLVAQLERRIAEPETRNLLATVTLAERVHQDAFELAFASRMQTGVTPRMSAPPAAQLELALISLVTHLEAVQVRALALARLATDRFQRWLVMLTISASLFLVALCVWFVNAMGSSFRVQMNALTRAERGQSQARVTLSQVEAASHLKDEFLATVSHELRNPLAPILTWTQLLRSGTLDEEKTRRALEVIERSVTSQAQLIDDLVDVSRVASGKFRLDVRPIDVVPVIRSAAESQGPASDAKQIRLQLVLDERAGVISGDSERLQQVMWNLISNAIKFTPKGGRVQVVLRRVESHIEIEVSDSGSGIDPEFLPHVFEPFRQGTGGSMRRHGGLGLGLSIVRHIVELHGGEISAFSEGLGLGSKFLVKIPLPVTATAPGMLLRRHPIARDLLAPVHLARLDGVHVMIVEDEESAFEALLVLFQSCGADARGARSVPEAMTLFTKMKPDVLVSDIAMPGEDGYALIRKIRRLPPEQGGATPAVALTAYAKIEDRVTILAAGFQMYLSKPADPNELVAVVGSLAHRHSSKESTPPA